MLKIADLTFHSRLFTGTGKFASANLMQDAIEASGSQLVTMAMKRIDLRGQDDGILQPLQELGVKLLPNTSGAKNAQEAVFAARLAREALGTNWVKLEIHPDMRYLLPIPSRHYSPLSSSLKRICCIALLQRRSSTLSSFGRSRLCRCDAIRLTDWHKQRLSN